jgi:hypothetical protein
LTAPFAKPVNIIVIVNRRGRRLKQLDGLGFPGAVPNFLISGILVLSLTSITNPIDCWQENIITGLSIISIFKEKGDCAHPEGFRGILRGRMFLQD